MRKNLLGQSEISVSSVCLGTMTFGEQNNVKDAHAQLDLALEMGINFIDTAEMYPVPPKNASKGLSEEFIGHWPKIKSERSSLIIATKIIGATNLQQLRENILACQINLPLEISHKLDDIHRELTIPCP